MVMLLLSIIILFSVPVCYSQTEPTPVPSGTRVLDHEVLNLIFHLKKVLLTPECRSINCKLDQECSMGKCTEKPAKIGDLCEYNSQCRNIAYDVICENNHCTCGEGKEFRSNHCFDTWKSTDTLIIVLSTFLPIALTICLTLTIVSCISRRRRALEEARRASIPDVARVGGRGLLHPAFGNSVTSNMIVPEDDKPPSYVAPPTYSTVMAQE